MNFEKKIVAAIALTAAETAACAPLPHVETPMSEFAAYTASMEAERSSAAILAWRENVERDTEKVERTCAGAQDPIECLESLAPLLQVGVVRRCVHALAHGETPPLFLLLTDKTKTQENQQSQPGGLLASKDGGTVLGKRTLDAQGGTRYDLKNGELYFSVHFRGQVPVGSTGLLADSAVMTLPHGHIDLHYNPTGQPVYVAHRFDGKPESMSMLDEEGYSIAEHRGPGQFWVRSEKGEVGPWALERAKNPHLTFEGYAAKIAPIMRSPRQWLMYAKSYYRVYEKGHDVEDPFTNEPEEFGALTHNILALQGTSSAIASFSALGLGAIWLTRRSDEQIKVFMLGEGKFLVNFQELNAESIDGIGAVAPFSNLEDAFLQGVKTFDRKGEIPHPSLLFKTWKLVDGEIPALERLPEGHFKPIQISLDKIINPAASSFHRL